MTEIYFEKELTDVTFDVDALADWKSIATELGLENQLKLTNGKESPVPYPYMNTVMERVYETLCPQKDTLKDYSKMPIPLDVMKQIAFSSKEHHFSRIEIWSDTKTPDPIAVGILAEYYCIDRNYNKVGDKFHSKEEAEAFKTANDLYTVNETVNGRYLIARWGDELCSFVELKQRAVKRFTESYSIELKKKIANATAQLTALSENTSAYFNGTGTKYDFERGTHMDLPF